MFNKICMCLASLMLGLFTIKGFAISPGAGQAQVRNNMQTMQQNKQRMKNSQQIQQNYQTPSMTQQNRSPRPASQP